MYTVTIDSAGFTATAQVAITIKSQISIESVEATNVTCYGASNGAARLNLSGVTNSGYYLWSNGSTTPAITNIAAGNYAVSAADATGCSVSATIPVVRLVMYMPGPMAVLPLRFLPFRRVPIPLP